MLLLAWSCAIASSAPARLTVNGTKLLDPSGGTVRFLGFNWQIGHERPGDGSLLNRVAPGANTVRLVGLLWGNTPAYRGRGSTTALASGAGGSSVVVSCQASIRARSGSSSPTAPRLSSTTPRPSCCG